MTDDWRPAIADGPGALYERLVAALERDVAAGTLSAGTRLPPQRELAYRLGLSVGTVAKAYVLAEQRGLVAGQVGRGTFVRTEPPPASRAADPAQMMDLAFNIIPHAPAAKRFAESVAAIAKRPDLLECLNYCPAAGPEDQRRAAVTWLRGVANIELDWTRLIMTCGAQQAMWLAFNILCKAGEVILCEPATYFGIKSIAEQGSYRLHALEMDSEGILPASLERAIAATGARVLYTMPTLQNPTGATMGPKRREDIARIARRHQISVVEDDAYSLFAQNDAARPVPLTAIIPERCFYIHCLSKSISAGLRIGFLHCPPGPHFDAAIRIVRASVFAPSALSGLIFTHWVEDGSVARITEAVRAEITARTELARSVLAMPWSNQVGNAPHVWLPMGELEAERVAGQAYREGAAITPPAGPIVAGGSLSGLRVCLGSVATITDLSEALRRLQIALSPPSGGGNLGMV